MSVLFPLLLVRHPGRCAAAMLGLRLAFVAAGELSALAEAHLYADEIVDAESTPYQRIVPTRCKDDLRLHLNNNLQFSSRDEYRNHEALVYSGLASRPCGGCWYPGAATGWRHSGFSGTHRSRR